MNTVNLSDRDKEAILNFSRDFNSKDPDVRLKAIIAVSNLVPMGSMYVRVPAMKKLISTCNIMETVLKLKDVEEEIRTDELFFLSQIVNKIIVSAEEICSFKKDDVLRDYYKFLIKISQRKDLPESVSNNIFARGVYYMTCIDKEYGGEVLYDVVLEEKKNERLFNAGHAALDWLFCINQSRTLSAEEVLLFVEIISKICKKALDYQESEMTSGFAKGLLWLVSNFKYFFMNGVSSNPSWLVLIRESRFITSETIAGLAKLFKIGLMRSVEMNDYEYNKKFSDMGKNALSLICSIIAVDGSEEAFAVLSKAFIHITGNRTDPKMRKLNEPIVLKLSNADEIKKFSDPHTLYGWLETSSNSSKKVDEYIESLGSLDIESPDCDIKVEKLIFTALFCTKYLTHYSKIGTVIFDKIKTLKQLKYYESFAYLD